jgi:hypothetical protein
MTTSKTWAGQTFNLPLNREPKSSNWGTQVSNFLIHISDKALAKTGGLQSLETELNLGTVAGIAALTLKGVTGTIASEGFIRLANGVANNGNAIVWRNAGNTADLALKANASNRLEYDAVAVPTISSTDAFTNKTLTDSTNNIGADRLTSGSIPDARVPASNVTQHVGSLVHQSLSGAGTNTHANIDTFIANENAIIAAQKEPTGFEDPDNTVEEYDKTTRKVTITHSSGTIAIWHRGVRYTLTSPYLSAAHDDTTSQWFLSLAAGGGVSWSATAWDFEVVAPIAYVYYNKVTDIKFCIRECHGLEPWQSHKRGHELQGTYVRSGGLIDASSVTINTDSDVAVTPATESVIVADEDLPTTLTAWPQGSYTRLHMISSAEVFTTSASYPFPVAGGKIQYNPTGTSLADVSVNQYVNVYAIYAPTTADSASQSFRVLWMIGQTQYSSLAAAQGEDFRTLVLGNLKTIFPEFVPYARLSYQYGAGFSGSTKSKLQGISYLTGSRNGSVNVTGFTPTDHNSLTGRSDTASHPASALVNTPSGNLDATDVQAALNELQSDIDSRIPNLGTVTDNRLVKTFGTDGKALEQTGLSVDDSNNLSGVVALAASGVVGKASTSQLNIPAGTEAQRATGVQGDIRYNTTAAAFEGHNGSAWKGLGGGGLIVTPVNHTVTTLDSGKHYLIDMSGASADVTVTLPAGAAESALRVSVLNNATSGFRVTLARNGSDTIAYDSVTTYTDAKIVYADQWVELSWRTTYWVIDDASSPLNGTFSGAFTTTGPYTPQGGIVGNTTGTPIATGYIGNVVTSSTLTGSGLTSGVVNNLGYIILQPGSYLVFGVAAMSFSSAPTSTIMIASISDANNAHTNGYLTRITGSLVWADSQVLTCPVRQIDVNAGGITLYLNVSATYSGGTGVVSYAAPSKLYAIRIA